jgi:hypothetical protein
MPGPEELIVMVSKIESRAIKRLLVNVFCPRPEFGCRHFPGRPERFRESDRQFPGAGLKLHFLACSL